MKPNTESTKAERLRIVIGSMLAAVGVLVVVIIGAMYGYHNATIWFTGLLLILGGVIISKSTALANFLNNILRF